MKIRNYKNQKGNVLFLILIAVALFAALSYAVTQSSRSGGDATKETNVINTAALTQYPNSVRTAVLRMIIGATDPLDIYFNKPDQFEGAGYTYVFDTTPDPDVNRTARLVFHPQGGGASYQQVPSNLAADAQAIDWAFTADYEVPLLGISASGSSGNELIAFAVGVTENICTRVNKELQQFDGIPVIGTAITIANERTATTTAPAAPTEPTPTQLTSTTPASPNWFSNKAFGCFENGTGTKDYVFYYVMAER